MGLLNWLDEAMRGHLGAEEDVILGGLRPLLNVMYLLNWLDFEVTQGSFLAYFANSHGRHATLAAQALSTSEADGLSQSASSRCSTVMNSWRFWRASTNAMCRLTSSSWAIISLLFLVFLVSRLFHYTLQGMLVLSGVCRDLLHFGGCNVAGVDAADADPLPVHLKHHLGGPLPGHAEELL